MRTLNLTLIILLLYVLFIADFHASLETKKHLYKFEYNGLLWVSLDYWSIVKYKSTDVPMKFISFQVLKNVSQ